MASVDYKVPEFKEEAKYSEKWIRIHELKKLIDLIYFLDILKVSLSLKSKVHCVRLILSFLCIGLSQSLEPFCFHSL